ncbi:MAG TPA: DUF167 domain-containing protein [Candidatus Hydrogenedentes bacterium]|jgi:uncharacterized protein (TIGR00251 family)|nr:DUF167 domain-containing protein [Candidatus Hydrogenedentota bacterium]
MDKDRLTDSVVDKGNDTLVKVFVQPRASKTSLSLHSNGRLRLSVMASPVEGAANEAVIAHFSKILKKNKTSFSLVGGQHSREKTILIRDVLYQDVLRILENNLTNK